MATDEQEQIPQMKPEISFLFELVRDVVAGKIRIPDFQRQFVWRRDQMTDLLDSIRKQFPIGSLLVWDTEIPLKSKEWVGPVRVASSAAKVSTGHVLDGQQRLTTLVGSLWKPEIQDEKPDEQDPARWRIWFNADKNEFEHIDDMQKKCPYHFPVDAMINTISFLEECTRMLKEGGDSGRAYVKNAESMMRLFQAYKVPVIRISNTELNKAVEIFSRLNNRGQAITPDQMISALTYSEDPPGAQAFNLATGIDRLIDCAEERFFGNIDRTVILRAFLAVMGQPVYKTDWTRMDPTKRTELAGRLRESVAKTEWGLQAALEFLGEMGIRTARLLPYVLQLVVLTAFFCRRPDPTDQQRRFLRRWIWVSSFTGYFASGNPSKVESLIKEFYENIALQDSPSYLNNLNLQEASQPFPKTFDMRSARVRSFLNVLLELRPMDEHGEEIDTPWKKIFDHGSNAMGRIFATVHDKKLDASPANRILRPDQSVSRQAKSWLVNLQNMEEFRRDAILKSHGIPSEAYVDLLNNQHEEFLRKRLDHLIKLELIFMQREAVTPPTSLIPAESAIDNDD
ncbi:MAG: DUF262 domain-containing protein [Magnetococcales bacterium]|nr:DUF262 domain-containing protein [Magnetococcales bacterium]